MSVVARARERLGSSALVQNGGISFFLATSAANVANFLFHVVMSRQLGPATYGALGSLLGLTTVVTLAVTAFQAAVTQAVAEDSGQELHVGRSIRRTAGVGLLLLATLSALSPLLRGFLHLSSVLPVVLFGCSVAGLFTTLVPQGVLIGRLRFNTVALALASGAVLRLASGPLFVHLGWGLNGAVAATVVNAVVTLAVLVWPLRHELAPPPPGAREFRFRPRTAVLAVAALGGVSAFVGIDTFLARHYLPRTESGYYVAAATAARIALFLPAAVGMLAFPRLAARGGRGPEARQVLLHAAGAVTVLGGMAALVIAAVPRTVIDVLFGDRYAPAAPALRILAVAAAAVSIATVCVYALLARRSPLSVVAWPALGVLAAAVALVHDGVVTIAWLVLGASAALLGATALALVGTASLRLGRRRDGDVASLHTGRRPPGTRTGTDPS